MIVPEFKTARAARQLASLGSSNLFAWIICWKVQPFLMFWQEIMNHLTASH